LGALDSSACRSALGRSRGAVARLREGVATSAGGIVIRLSEDRPQLVLGMRRRDRDGSTWTLPKGTPETGETLEQTALREVGEETGLEVAITGPLGSIQYSFVQRGTRIHKTVHYFTMVARGGDLSRHDREFEQVRWMDLDEAMATLTFETERDLVGRAAVALGLATTHGTGVPAAPAS
jgi:8-oxo-dGTP pyrophosphatase MutT (NUDIX family)